jgi:hypothetical protein
VFALMAIRLTALQDVCRTELGTRFAIFSHETLG